MGKTAAERQRKRRQRLRENPAEWNEYLERDRERKNTARKNLSPGEIKTLRARTLAAVKKHRGQIDGDGTEAQSEITASAEAEEDFPEDNIPDEVLVENSEKPLSAALRARIERNRQRALMLREARLNSKPYSKPNGKSIMKVCSSEIDTGAGFFLDEDQEKDLKNQKVIYEEAPSLPIDFLNCENCDQKFTESYLLKNFKCFVCDSCREENDEKYNLITKTDAKTKYLLNDVDLDKREPKLKFIVRKNPHNPRWGDMKLYLESQVKCRAIDVWESEEKLEAAKEAKIEKRVNMKKKKFNKKMKDLRMSVRSSLWQKQTSTHQHSYGEESYDEEEDMYSKTCTTCGNVMTYEKM